MKITLAAALAVALAVQARAQDRTGPDANVDRQDPQQRIPQGPGSPGFGHGMPAGSRFRDDAKVDAQTDAEPTDRQGARTETPAQTPTLETNPTPSRTDVGSEVIQEPSPGSRKGRKSAPKGKGKKTREDVEKSRRNGRKAPRPPVDRELPAVTDPTKDGTLIDDTQDDVPHD